MNSFFPYEGEDGKVRCSECHEVVYEPALVRGMVSATPHCTQEPA
jgi:formylmethanofuran dehydrogenase subunit E